MIVFIKKWYFLGLTIKLSAVLEAVIYQTGFLKMNAYAHLHIHWKEKTIIDLGQTKYVYSWVHG